MIRAWIRATTTFQQSVEFGYRANEVNGNEDTYDTFVNLGPGVRLFDYTLDMRSLNHQGLFFDNLNFSNFGYGGDPNDVSRLHIDKNKWYDFHVLFRRDKNFWDYNLFANPLNPAAPNPVGSETTGCIVSGPTTAHPGLPGYCSNPAIAQNNSPHSLDLVRRMQDYDLTLLPQSRVRFRLGFSHDRDQGPGFFTTDSGTVPDFPENYSYTTNAYRAGVDFRILPRTTISYDQFLTYFKQDNVVTENPAATPGQLRLSAGERHARRFGNRLEHADSRRSAALRRSDHKRRYDAANGHPELQWVPELQPGGPTAKLHAHRAVPLPIELFPEIRDDGIDRLQQHRTTRFPISTRS